MVHGNENEIRQIMSRFSVGPTSRSTLHDVARGRWQGVIGDC